MLSVNFLAWGVYILFVFLAFYLNWHSAIYSFNGEMGFIKMGIAIVYISFLLYSIHCSLRENIFRSITSIMKFYWGRQIGFDLYLGLSLGLLIIYLHEGALALMLWLLPTLAFANLSMLLYFIIHFDTIISKLLI